MKSRYNWSDWLAFGNKRSPGRNRLKGRRLAMEPLETRQLLSATAFDPDVAFSTVDQDMWAAGAAASISEEFDYTLLDVDFNTPTLGGFLFGTGLEVAFGGGLDLGFRGEFDITGGEVDVDYQTDITVSALTTSGGTLGTLVAGDHFILRATELPNPGNSSMETEFANISAGMFLDYDVDVSASMLGKLGGSTVVNTGFNKSFTGSQSLIEAELNPGTGAGELSILKGIPLLEQTWDLRDALAFDIGGGIVEGNVFVPKLNTGVAGDGFDDSAYDLATDTIVNKHLPVDRTQGQTRIDFFRLGIGLDNIVTAITGIPLSLSVGTDVAALDVALINATLEAYLGVAQEMTFDPSMMVDYNFQDTSGNPLSVNVETSPGSGVFQSVTTKRVPFKQGLEIIDLEIIHGGGDLIIDTDYVLTGTFRNDTNLYLSPAFTLDIGAVELSGSLVDTAVALIPGLDSDDLSFSIFSETFALTPNPIELVGLFDQTFDLGGFSEVDGKDLSVTATTPPTFTVVATSASSTINEGQDMVVTGTVFDPAGANNGPHTYSLAIDWKDGTTQTVTLDSNTTAANNGVTYDTATQTFSATHHYGNNIGSKDLSFTATRTTDTSQTDGATVSVQVDNVAPVVSVDPLSIDSAGNATLTGSYTDPGLGDSQFMSVNWGILLDSLVNIDDSISGFIVPGSLSGPLTIQSSSGKSATLKITSVDASGQVGFEITGFNYTGTDPTQKEGSLSMQDIDNGSGSDLFRVPWGLDLEILNSSVTTINEHGSAALDLGFTDDFSETIFPTDAGSPGQFLEAHVSARREYEVVIDWNDPNDSRVSTFDVRIDHGGIVTWFSDTGWIVGVNTNAVVTNTSGDDAVLTVENVQTDIEVTEEYNVYTADWDVTPTFKVSRLYADDGDASAGNGTSFDVSNVVVNVFEKNLPRGSAASTTVTVNNVAPTVAIGNSGKIIGPSGLAVLNGTISDPGRLDARTLDVTWGDGSTFDNDDDPDTAEDSFQRISFAPSAAGLQNFTLNHIYETEPDGGTYTVTAKVTDDDGLSSADATTDFLVDFDLSPVAFADFVGTEAGLVLNIDPITDNDDDPHTHGDVDPEGDLDASKTLFVADSLRIDFGSGPEIVFNSNAMVTSNGDGTLTFDTGALVSQFPVEFATTDFIPVSFSYQIEDTAGQTATGVVTVFVSGTNQAPTAVVDTGATTTEGLVTVNVIDNDTDPDASDTLRIKSNSARIVSVDAGPSDGSSTVEIIDDNNIKFIPGSEFSQLRLGDTSTVVIEYDVEDHALLSDTGTLTVSVAGTSTRPVISFDNTSVAVANEGATAGMSGTIRDPQGLFIASFVADVGTISLDASAGTWEWEYTPNDGPDDSQQVTITATNSEGSVETQTFSLVVNNVAPILGTNTATVQADQTVTVDVLQNDFDPAGANDPLQVVKVTGAAVGTLVSHDGAAITYDPNGAFDDLKDGETALDILTYEVIDDDGGLSQSTFAVTIEGVNDAPTVATPIDDFTVPENNQDLVLILSIGTFFSTFVDVDGDELTYSASSSDTDLIKTSIQGPFGDVVLSFQPNEHGSAVITVTATDPDGASVSESFIVTVNDAPTVVNPIKKVTVNADAAPTVIDLAGVFADVNGDTLSLSASSSDETLVNASISNTSLTLSYLADQHGEATITVTAADAVTSVSHTFAVTVLPQNLVVNTEVDEQDGSITDGDISLRDAIQAIAPGGTITFADSLSGQSIVRTPGMWELRIAQSMTIDAEGKDITIDANNSNNPDGFPNSVFTILDGDFNSQISVSLVGLTLTGGFAKDFGGGILNGESLSLTDSTIVDNFGRSGGGGIVNFGTMSIVNSTISGNSTEGVGGGIYSVDRLRTPAQLSVHNSTIAGNSANQGGGIGTASTGAVTLASTIVADNTATASNPDLYNDGGTIDASFSLIENDVDQINGVKSDNVTGQDPLLDPAGLQDNGGPTRTIALQGGSPAIDAGSNPNALPHDQRGFGFERVFGNQADIGAFEFIDPDTDGVGSSVEDAAPNGGDGNNDNIPDSEQNNVTSLPNAVDQEYVTLVTPEGTTLDAVSAQANPSPADAPANVDFPAGFIDFQAVTANSSTAVTIFLPADTVVNTYYKYGPEPGNATDHWYEFLFDGSTGAELFDDDADGDTDRIVLHFRDGGRGDDDLTANGVIVDPGAAGFANQPPTISSQSFDVAENQTAVGVIAAEDLDLPDDTLTFSIGGAGADDAKFSVTAGGELIFNAAPDFENPTDSNGDNLYEVEVEVTDDAGETAMATMSVTVTNQTATISGTVFADANFNGLFDGGTETAIDGVEVNLLRLIDDTFAEFATDETALGGVYAFTVDDEFATYRIQQTQPTGVEDGAAILGDANGNGVTGEEGEELDDIVESSNEMRLTLTGFNASDYDFTELGQSVQAGDTAGIGFWQNKRGQALIAAGGTGLAQWMTEKFENVFGHEFVETIDGDGNPLEFKGSDVIASFYKNEFFKKKLKGTSKVDAQFMATALATFFTSSNLAGTVATGYGFNVTETGIGARGVNVAANGLAFGVADNTDMTIMAMLLWTNSLTGADNDADDGNDYSHIYDTDGDGILDADEKALRAMANQIYTAINEGGGN